MADGPGRKRVGEGGGAAGSPGEAEEAGLPAERDARPVEAEAAGLPTRRGARPVEVGGSVTAEPSGGGPGAEPSGGDPAGPPAGAETVALIKTLGHVRWPAVLPLAAAIALGLGVLSALPYLGKPLELLVVAITLAEALTPIVEVLSRRVSRGVSIAIVYVVLVAGAVGVGWIVVPPMVRQAQALVDRAPAILGQVENFLSHWDRLTSGRLAGVVAGMPSRIGDIAVRLPMEFLGGVFDLVLILFLSVYWLAGAPRVKGFTLSLLRPRHRAKAAVVLHEVGRNMGGYVRGTVINAAIMGALSWIGLTIIGVPFPVVLGVLTMLGELVPIVGPVAVGSIVALIALTHSLRLAIFAVLLYTALAQIEGHLLTPNIMRKQTNVPQTLVLFAIVVGGGAGGLLGIIVSVPLAAALRVFVLEVLAPWERRAAGAEPRPPAPSAPPVG